MLYSALHASIKNSKCAPEDTRSEYFYSAYNTTRGCDERVAADAEVVALAAAQHVTSTAQLSGSSIYGGVGPKNKDLQTVA